MSTYARFVAISYVLLGGWILLINLIEQSYTGWVLVWVLGAGLFGLVGGVLFLLGMDGPAGMRSRKVRLAGWIGMCVLGLLPWSFWFVMLALLVPLYALLSEPSNPANTTPPG